MPKYTVQSPVKSGGKIRDIGATIALDEEAAAHLLALGRITPLLGVAKDSSDDGSSDDGSTENSGDAARQAAEPRTAAGKPKGGKK